MAIDLSYVGLDGALKVHRNLSKAELVEASIRKYEGVLSKDGVFVANTGKYTGRSPNDKFTVKDELTSESIWWGTHNQPMEPVVASKLGDKIAQYLSDKELFVQDCFGGADKHERLAVRVISERAWHSSFAQNMFIEPSHQELVQFQPDFTVIHAPGFKADSTVDGTASEAAIIVDFSRKRVLICGSEYAGEIKKSIFSILNYQLPERGLLGMHCSSNKSNSGETALFFGLSGTGKTTLSADPARQLIGDDEHGWGDNGVFNFEGGCYAKVIKLSEQDEPEIFATTKKFGTILENVVINDDRSLDLDSAKFTENTRASYDITAIPNADLSGLGGHPNNIVMLTCDAFGVLPPISKLTKSQAMYHFLSGYTAKVAGTERGVIEPQATFSACFGAPFMPRHPSVYAELLGKKMDAHGSSCWLVNTGWTKGPYGTGERVKIKWTRALLNAALDGSLAKVDFEEHPIFKVLVPKHAPNVPEEILNPKNTWENKAAYDEKAKALAELFQVNFRAFLEYVDGQVVEDAQPG